ncbi:ATP phosphoribosyltransferase [Lutibaculum baratangense]|uniref:ATP phosphoribosyltransferase n=1 Tax=Lutibaculum baratangense AMV1 TaxID=631454 RepID=V4RJJ2_9HYPH|nr:ATP phosphoribosyltransferase [Lutibaculum baratangense]ESR25494.1 ATP phosphoribosyltransferase [Lutibaculum baratangense AMV1]
MSADSLIIAVPSKGRLQENADAFFARAGLVVERGRGARDYRGSFKGIPDVEVWFLSASEIARELAEGKIHLGVTGEDLLREQIPETERAVELVTPLGFGYARVVVAVPQLWIDVRTMADLDDVAQGFRARHGRRLRVATKYVNLTRAFFSRHAVGDYRIVESAGATEGAPASGAADLIVDITTTGATLAANALKVLDDGLILASEAHLTASLTASWTPERLGSLRTILDRISAEERARTTREVRAALPATADPAVLAAENGADLLAHEAGRAVFHCPKGAIHELAAALIAAGATAVGTASLDYVFRATNPLFDRVTARLADLQR